ncbi:MAG: hypothetical protein BWY83_00696 [bacterium ADurb.Bin478]|nr:MAG: hypothetical protein BWY83_00696 [bacterium ADurb.Bin478]
MPNTSSISELLFSIMDVGKQFNFLHQSFILRHIKENGSAFSSLGYHNRSFRFAYFIDE